MSDIPAPMLEARRLLSERFLAGQGIEIGALHHPLWVGERASVRYVDRLDEQGLRHHYPELREYDLVAVDIVDDGETLGTVADGTLDFVIANHMLEHTENPIGTIRNHLRKIRPGGVLYYAIPDRRYSFDVDRPLTQIEHLIRDDREGPQISRDDHYREWTRLVSKIEEPGELEAHAAHLNKASYSIHFHVWQHESFVEFLGEVRDYLGGAFTIEHLEVNGNEVVAILRRPLLAAA